MGSYVLRSVYRQIKLKNGTIKIEKIERVQKIATRIPFGFEKLERTIKKIKFDKFEG